MHKSLRRAASALPTATLLLVLASPALAAPQHESAAAPRLVAPHAFADLLAWLGSWLDPAPIESYAAPGGQSVDPNGQPAVFDPVSGPVLTPEGGGTVDPDG